MSYKICHECNGVMYPCKISNTYNVNGKSITINDINAFKCIKCGEIIFENKEVERMEAYIKEHMEE